MGSFGNKAADAGSVEKWAWDGNGRHSGMISYRALRVDEREVKMGCYFMVDIYISDPEKQECYDEYIRKVKPIVESFGGEYLVRTEDLSVQGSGRFPDRVIVVRFPDRKHLDDCFVSPAYRSIMDLRIGSVESRIVIAEGM